MAATDIPVIDISSLCNDTGARLVHAIHEWGFAFVKGDNTGFTADAIGHIFELGDLKEVFNLGEFVDGKAQQLMPHALVDYQKDFDDFAAQCRTLCMQLLRLFALGLKIDPAEGGRDCTVHRVVFPLDNEKADRYSIAYFFHPSNETRLTAVPSDLIHQANAFSDKQQEEVAGLKVVTAEEHLRRRLAATYGWDHLSEAVD
ncbi:MAG: hypothetical protein Q9197_001052 [Variospora fuerteventurae]